MARKPCPSWNATRVASTDSWRAWLMCRSPAASWTCWRAGGWHDGHGQRAELASTCPAVGRPAHSRRRSTHRGVAGGSARGSPARVRATVLPAGHQKPTGNLGAARTHDTASTARWLELVYSPTTLITAIADYADRGVQAPVSSSTKPDLMIRMLEALQVGVARPGQLANQLLAVHEGAIVIYSVAADRDAAQTARDAAAALIDSALRSGVS